VIGKVVVRGYATAGYAREASYDENRTELYENGTELPVLRTCTPFYSNVARSLDA